MPVLQPGNQEGHQPTVLPKAKVVQDHVRARSASEHRSARLLKAHSLFCLLVRQPETFPCPDNRCSSNMGEEESEVRIILTKQLRAAPDKRPESAS